MSNGKYKWPEPPIGSSNEHYKKHVLPHWKKHGLSPEFSNAVDKHVKKFGKIEADKNIWNHHGGAGGESPKWWDQKTGRVKKLKKSYSINEQRSDTEEKIEMAQTQLHFLHYAAKEILDFIEQGGEIEEWYQNKLSKVHSDMESLHSYIEGESRRTGMKEDFDLNEKAPPGEKYERMVKHIKKSYAKRDGGLTDKEKSIAFATAWKAYKKNKK